VQEVGILEMEIKDQKHKEKFSLVVVDKVERAA
jgi:hypothetical protein